MTLLEALKHAAVYSADDADEDRAREAGSLLEAMRIVLVKKKVTTITELRKSLGVEDRSEG